MIKNSLLSCFCIITLLLTPGCFFTRFGECAYSIGNVKYYADGAYIKDNVLYRVEDTYYVYAAEVAYTDSPDWYAVAMHPRNKITEQGYSGRYVLVVLAPDSVEYVLSEESEEPLESEEYAFDEKWKKIQLAWANFYGRVCTEPIDLSDAKRVTPKRRFSHPLVQSMCCGESLHGAIYVRSEKSASSWLLAPLMVVGFAVDVPVFIAGAGVTIALAPVVISVALIAKAFGK